ncbi:unnamed protein product, partial [Prorocentrum cordatum]
VHAVRLPQLQLQDPMHAVRSSDASWGDGRHARAAGGPEFGHGDMRPRPWAAWAASLSLSLSLPAWVSSAHLPSSTSHEPRTMRRSWHVI